MNLRPFGVQADTLTHGAHQPGPRHLLKSVATISAMSSHELLNVFGRLLFHFTYTFFPPSGRLSPRQERVDMRVNLSSLEIMLREGHTLLSHRDVPTLPCGSADSALTPSPPSPPSCPPHRLGFLFPVKEPAVPIESFVSCSWHLLYDLPVYFHWRVLFLSFPVVFGLAK